MNRHLRRALLWSLLCCTLTGALLAQAPPNDECTGALALRAGRNGPFQDRRATSSQPLLCGRSGLRDVWFSYLAPTSGAVLFELELPVGGVTPILYVEALRGPCSNLVSAQCAGGLGGLLRCFLLVNAGEQILLRAGSAIGGASAEFDVVVTEVGPVTNDECANALPLRAGNNGLFSSLGATTSLPFDCYPGATGDVWFRYVSPFAGEVEFQLCTRTEFQPVLEVRSGDCGSSVSRICRRPACGFDRGAVLRMAAGEIFWVRVGGLGGTSGLFDLRILEVTPPGNDECSGAIQLTSGRQGPFALAGSSQSLPWFSTYSGDIWFRCTAPVDGEFAFLFCSTPANFHAQIQVFEGPCTALGTARTLHSLSCSEDHPLRLTLRAGETRFFRLATVAAFPYRASFEIETLFSTPPANDACGGAIELQEGTNGSFPTLGATLSGTFPCQWGTVHPPRDLWFRYQPTEAPSLVLFETCFESQVQHAMELVRGDCASRESLACATQGCITYTTRGARIAFEAPDNRPLYLRLGTYDAQPRGNLKIQVTELRQPNYRRVATGCEWLALRVDGDFRPGLPIQVRATRTNGWSYVYLAAGPPLPSPLQLCPGQSCRLGVEPWAFLFGGSAVWWVPYEPWLVGEVLAVQAVQLPIVGASQCGMNPPVTSETIVFVFP